VKWTVRYDDCHSNWEVSVDPEGSPSRTRIVVGAADMMRRRGLNAMSVRTLAEHANAPLGSTYHYFPGGKQQVATEAVEFTGRLVATLLTKALENGPAAGLRAFVAVWRKTVLDSDFRAGCPVLAVAIEEPPAGELPPALVAADKVLRTWQTLLTDSLRQHGTPADQAGQLATLAIAALEGAVVLCRAHRSIAPLDDVATQLETLIR
jgi:AcrR family transcriptional regulator